MARERGIYLFSDEVYRGVERRPEMTLPQVADIYERGISLGVMSKSYGLPGIRVGWVACRDRGSAWAHGADEALHVDLRGGAERIAGADCAEGAGADSGAEPGADCQELADAGGVFRGALRICSSGICRTAGASGFRGIWDATALRSLRARLVEESGVLLLPASVYRSDLGATPTDRFRIGYGRDNMEAGLAAMRAHLRKVGVARR